MKLAIPKATVNIIYSSMQENLEEVTNKAVEEVAQPGKRDLSQQSGITAAEELIQMATVASVKRAAEEAQRRKLMALPMAMGGDMATSAPIKQPEPLLRHSKVLVKL